MQEVLSHWANFYVILGSASGALIGLQFVVITLIADSPSLKNSQGGAAYITPTSMHFGVVLLVSALMAMPWTDYDFLGIVISILGFIGLYYSRLVYRRIYRQDIYRPVLEDWTFHIVLPATGYGILSVSAFFLGRFSKVDLFAVATANLSLLFAGVHNSWDAVTYHVFKKD